MSAVATYLRYGDNIYHRDDDETFKQEDSFHSMEDGTVSLGDLERDTGTTDKVLVGHDFAYWGRAGIKVPSSLTFLLKKGPSHRCRFTDEQVAAILAWIGSLPERGYIGEPAHWQFLGMKPKKKKKTL